MIDDKGRKKNYSCRFNLARRNWNLKQIWIDFFFRWKEFIWFLPLLRGELMCLEQSTMRGKKHGAVWACISKRKNRSDSFYFLWESCRQLLEIENDGEKNKFLFEKMGGKRWYFESVGYCLLDIWIEYKSFGQLGELASILFEEFELSIGLSRDLRKN